MWFFEATTANTDGGGVCGGDDLYASGTSLQTAVSTLVANVYLSLSAESLNNAVSSADITGYGIRSGLSINSAVSTLDTSNGLTIINESGIITTNTNVLRFYGSTLYSGATLTRRSDATISSDGRITIDGGDAPARDDGVLISGGDAVNDNQILDGGSA